MRDIEFRAWDKENQEMITADYNDDHYILTLEYCKPVLLEFVGDDFGTYANIDADIMQYTGLRDKNGVKIFEGDILYIAGMGNCLVGFEDGFFGFTVESKTNIESIGHSLEDIETVIGSIHENPELINQ